MVNNDELCDITKVEAVKPPAAKITWQASALHLVAAGLVLALVAVGASTLDVAGGSGGVIHGGGSVVHSGSVVDGGGGNHGLVGSDDRLVGDDGLGDNDGLVDDGGGGVDGVSGTDDLSDESALAIDVVLDGADGAIGLHQAVLSLGEVALAGFLVGVDVLGVVIVDGVLEGVLSRSPVGIVVVSGGGVGGGGGTGAVASVVLGQAQGSGDEEKGGGELTNRDDKL